MHWCSDIVRRTDSDVWTLLGAWIDPVTSTLETAPGYKYGTSSGHRVHSVWLSQTDYAWSLECYFEQMKRGEKNGEVLTVGKPQIR